MSRLSRLSSSVAGTAVAVGAIAVLTAGTASAATITYTANGGGVTPPGVIYNCTFPGISPQPVAIVAQLDAPSSIAHGTSMTPTNVKGTATISAAVHALLTAVGYDGIRGKATVPVSVSSGTLSPTAASGLDIPQTIYPAGGPITVNISQVATSVIPTYTAPATAGTATLSLTNTLSATLDFHKPTPPPNGTWSAWTMNCTLKVTSPPQNLKFTPNITIT
jgi:hypothetical protein